ncbi:hypothetical protein A2W24_06540 [Microgenomates group bacterium RBG_16_45_19]|nr:MAG: hypothetical protein A2W24_06540 [Microgenomates group bacterium RBG_16_45_19]
MDQPLINQVEPALAALARRDKILSALTSASDVFLRGSLATWQENVLQVLRHMGGELGVRRIFLCKHQEITAKRVLTSLRYEWLAAGDQTRVDVAEFQNMNLNEGGFERWAEVLYPGGVLYGERDDFPEGERQWFLSPQWQTLIVVSVFVEWEWWGFIVIEDYSFAGGVSAAELDAFKTVAVTFGAAIRRKRMEESLLRERAAVEEKAKQVADVARFPSEDPWPVLRVKHEGTLTYANRAAEPLIKNWQVTVGGVVGETQQALVNQVIKQGAPLAVDALIGKQTFSLLFVPIMEADYANVYGHDVSRERELDRLKSEFLAIASHQLRTPLTSMRWYSERLLAKRQGLAPDQIEMTQVIHDSSVHLAGLVNDLLNVSRIERGKIEPEPVLSHLKSMIEEVLAELMAQLVEKKIDLKKEIDEEVAPFYFDPELIRQVITNLVANAIKYSRPAGVVVVKVFLFDQHHVGVEVVDQGIGIPEAEQVKIFEKFFRASNARTHAAEGTGLGLALCQMIVEKSGGRIWFTSAPGQGSTFAFVLPYRRS